MSPEMRPKSFGTFEKRVLGGQCDTSISIDIKSGNTIAVITVTSGFDT